MSNIISYDLIEKIISIGGNAKMVSVILIALSVLFGGVCFFYTGNSGNAGTDIAEEVIEGAIKAETGVDVDIDLEKIIPPKDKTDKKTGV